MLLCSTQCENQVQIETQACFVGVGSGMYCFCALLNCFATYLLFNKLDDDDDDGSD